MENEIDEDFLEKERLPSGKSKKIQIKSNPDLENYINEFTDDVKVTEFNLREKSLTCSSIWAKWLSYLHLEKETLQRISQAKKKVLASKMKEVKSSDSILRMKSEDKIIESDETMKKLAALAKQTQDRIDYIERALGILSNFGYQLRNITEVYKLQFNH